MSVSVIVPVYNEEENIAPLVTEICSLDSMIPDLEVIFVDDGSTDGTWQKLKQCANEYSCLRPVHYDRNRGQSSAMLVGLNEARGEIIVTMDGDAQNNPADIPMLIDKITECDVVCGYRAKRKDTWARRKGSRLANWVRNRVTRDQVRDTGCSLKAFKRECLRDLPPIDGVHRFMPAYFRMNGRSIKEVAVDHRPRVIGTSKYTNMKRLPKTIYDLFGFVWYRKRYLPPIRNDELSKP